MGEPPAVGASRAPEANRRAHNRVERALSVHVRPEVAADSHLAEIVNISAGGVLLRTDLSLGADDVVTIDLDIPGEPKPISVYGTVVRRDDRGVGVSFVRTSKITRDLIAYLVRKWQR